MRKLILTAAKQKTSIYSNSFLSLYGSDDDMKAYVKVSLTSAGTVEAGETLKHVKSTRMEESGEKQKLDMLPGHPGGSQ